MESDSAEVEEPGKDANVPANPEKEPKKKKEKKVYESMAQAFASVLSKDAKKSVSPSPCYVVGPHHGQAQDGDKETEREGESEAGEETEASEEAGTLVPGVRGSRRQPGRVREEAQAHCHQGRYDELRDR